MEKALKDIPWKEFKIGDIFEVDKGIYLHQKTIINGSTPYITAKTENNGINRFIGNNHLFSGNAITIEKINLSAYYQSIDFYCSHDVTVIRNSKLNKYNSLFICSMINRQAHKYSYGRQAQMNVVKNEKVFLPITDREEPDYEYMEQYLRKKEQEKTTNYRSYILKFNKELININEIDTLTSKDWKEFYLTEIFPAIQRGKRLKKDNHIKGMVPYASSTGANNGIDVFIGNRNNVRIFNNCLTLANSGSIGACFYQPFHFIASDHITKLENRNYNKYIYLFISAIISRLGKKYSFNREINDTRIKKEKIMLPINKQGNPDYKYMEQYMKRLEYKKLNIYLDYLEAKSK